MYIFIPIIIALRQAFNILYKKIVFFISIEIDGISIEELCPANGDGIENRTKAKHLLRGSTFGSPTQKVPANRYVNGAHLNGMSVSAGTDAATTTSTADNDDNTPENCMWPNALQVFCYLFTK